MNKSFAKWFLINAVTFAVTVIVLCFTISFVRDYSEYKDVMESDTKMPWYSENILQEPYTNFKLRNYPTIYRLETNAPKTEVWLCKEKVVGDKRFWTINHRFELLKYRKD